MKVVPDDREFHLGGGVFGLEVETGELEPGFGGWCAIAYSREGADKIARAVNCHAALLAACKEATEAGKHPEECGWWDHRYVSALIHESGVCDCYLSRLDAAVRLAEGTHRG